MPDRLAIKRLTASDLTFFESLFRTLGVGNQKSINLNRDVFVDIFYPSLPSLTPKIGDVIPVTLTILGPNGAPGDVLSRAVTKREAYKNWRLNGEFVRDPDGQTGRYDNLVAGDFAVIEFFGDPAPQKVSLLLISAKSATDAGLYTALNSVGLSGRRTMAQLSRGDLSDMATGIPASHPVWLFAADPEYEAALEDAALGGVEGVAQLAVRVAKPVSAATLTLAKETAEKNGREGEALAWVYLQQLKALGKLTSIEWSSKANAVSAYDFVIVETDGKKARIDAKSTNGDFGRSIHMSLAELMAAAEGERYDLWRIYKLDDNGGRLRIAKNIGATASKTLGGLKPPLGVTIDGVSINPEILVWGDEIAIDRPDESESDL